MSETTAEALLEGPRGRRLCLELLLEAAQRRQRGDDGWTAARHLHQAAYELDPGAGTSVVLLQATVASGAPQPQPDPDDERMRALPPAQRAAEALVGLPVPQRYDAATLRDALAASVDAARYWQQPDGEDVLAARPELRPHLLRAAEGVAASTEAAWWATPIDRWNQRSVLPDGGIPPSDRPAAEALDRWRAQWPLEQPDPAEPLRGDARGMTGGDWWSIPPFSLRSTTRELPGAGPAGIRWIEDGFGWNRFETVEASTAAGPVLELAGPDDWAALCRRFPIDLSASTHRHHWFDVTGEDRHWVLPDWSRVAEEYAGVHLSVLGYLRTATRLIELGDGRASVLAGWNPDATYWLRDGTRSVGEPTVWSRIDRTEDWVAGSV